MSAVDNQPLRYWNGNAVYLTMYLTLAMAAGLIGVFILAAAKVPVQALMFHPSMLGRGMFWTPLTYVFVNGLSFFTPLGLICFYSWGVEVEKYLGRRFFAGLLLALVLVPALVSTALYPLRLSGHEAGLAGNYHLVAGLLIAFATLYPDMEYCGGWIPLKWFAFALLACGAVTYLPERDWVGLCGLLATCATAYGLTRHGRGLLDVHFRLPNPFRRKPKLRVLPRPELAGVPRRSGSGSSVGSVPVRQPAPTVGMEEDMDSLLDKIARSGLASLSEGERARLEEARQELLRRGR